jgi:hypothetical protein
MSKTSEKKDKESESLVEDLPEGIREGYLMLVNDMKKLSKTYSLCTEIDKVQFPIPTHEVDIFLEMAEYYYEFCEEDMHSQQYSQELILGPSELKHAKTKESFLKSYALNQTNLKNLRFSSKSAPYCLIF